MVHIESRASWGARYQDGDRNLSGLAVGVYAHHTVTAQLSPSASVEQERAQMRAIESIGQSRFGTGISYNVIIFPSGRAYQGVSFNRRGTHTGGLNSSVRSICFAGNYEVNEPTPQQLATAAAIFAEGRGKWWTSSAYLKGHRDQKSTSCPGRHVYKHLAAIRGGTAGGGASAPSNPAPSTPKNYLGPGDRGAGVRELQQQLKNLGYNIGSSGVDGSYGPATTAAVKALQARAGIAVDGFAGPATRAAIARGVRAAGTPAPPKPAPTPSGIPVDGKWGPATTRALQKYLGTTVDGVISGQVKSRHNENLYSARWGKGGSNVIRALQRRLGVTADGYMGPGTISAMQRHLGTPVDGVISPTSTMVRRMQERLNAGNLF